MHGSQQSDVVQQQQQQAYVAQSEALTAAQLAPCAITQQDFQAAVKKVQPSVRREGFATTPDVTWGDVGSLAEVCTPSPCSSCCPLSKWIVCLYVVVYLCHSVCACMCFCNIHRFELPPLQSLVLQEPCCSLNCSTSGWLHGCGLSGKAAFHPCESIDLQRSLKWVFSIDCAIHRRKMGCQRSLAAQIPKKPYSQQVFHMCAESVCLSVCHYMAHTPHPTPPAQPACWLVSLV